MLGEVIGSYRIVSELGKGGMGMVYRAEHVQLGRPAALKMLHAPLSSDASIVQRFFNEARAASAIDHPGIVEIYDFGTHRDGRAYIVMALLRGESLEHRLRRGPVSPHDGATIIAQAVAALAAAHARGIVHRDLKPDNLFLVPNDLMPGGLQVKLLDFGIAKLADEQTAGFKTQTGALMGTPAYMSPEQCMGSADLDHRTDIYAVGCILFHLFCGRPPFVSTQGTGVMIAAHIRDAAPDPRSFQPQLPAALAMIVLRCLEKDPAARFQTATELRNALVAAGANAPLSQPPGAEQYAATLATPHAFAGSSPGALAARAAATTRGGAAAELVTPAPAAASSGARPRRSRAALIAGGVLVLGGVAAAIAWTRAGHDVPVSVPPPAERVAVAPVPPTPPTPPAGSAAADRAPAAEAMCPPGQDRRADTDGHCCWPAQAWSSSAGKCVGAPSCPEAMIARGDDCVAGDIARPRHPAHRPVAAAKPSTAPGFRLNATSYAPGDTIELRFAAPVSSRPNNRAWITVIEADRPASAYGVWAYLDDGVTVATLKAPSAPGAYEVRLHTDYPARTFNVQRAVAMTVGPERAEADTDTGPRVTPVSEQRFRVAAKTLHAGSRIDVTFAARLRAAKGEQFWITIVDAGAADTAWGAYEYVPAGARQIQLVAPAKPGDYELRLHANYPTRSTHVVHRAAIRVED
ncbi:MAG TPA: serine/threonine-protein kinase [Kofleriaceae bacterium]|jgi:serine/threonine-protein kinase